MHRSCWCCCCSFFSTSNKHNSHKNGHFGQMFVFCTIYPHNPRRGNNVCLPPGSSAATSSSRSPRAAPWSSRPPSCSSVVHVFVRSPVFLRAPPWPFVVLGREILLRVAVVSPPPPGPLGHDDHLFHDARRARVSLSWRRGTGDRLASGPDVVVVLVHPRPADLHDVLSRSHRHTADTCYCRAAGVALLPANYRRWCPRGRTMSRSAIDWWSSHRGIMGLLVFSFKRYFVLELVAM